MVIPAKSLVQRLCTLSLRFWRPATTVLVIEAIALSTIAVVGTARIASAGDTYPNNPPGNYGDCWQPLTPTMCRTTWTGRGSSIWMRLIDQMNDTGLLNAATAACNNWNNAPGPQFCSWTARANDTWTYMKVDNGISAPGGRAWNCINGACPTSNNAGNIQWSEIYVPTGNRDQQIHPCTGVSGNWAAFVFAHELGHAYGLDHHGASCSNTTLMSPGSTLWQGPTDIDIGPFPGCSGAAGTGGLRCIYQST